MHLVQKTKPDSRGSSPAMTVCFEDPCGPSHVRIVRSIAALRHHPIDILRRVLDVAGFAMHAVLRVDLKAKPSALVHHLINASGAIALRRLRIDRKRVADRNRAVLELQVNRLVLFVIGAGESQIGQAVEGYDAVGFGIIDRLEFRGWPRAFRIVLAVAQGSEERYAEEFVHPHIEPAESEAAGKTELRPQRLHVSDLPQIVIDPGILDRGYVI